MSQVVIHPIVRSSLVLDHCRVREIVIKKRIQLSAAWSRRNYATTPRDQARTVWCMVKSFRILLKMNGVDQELAEECAAAWYL